MKPIQNTIRTYKYVLATLIVGAALALGGLTVTYAARNSDTPTRQDSGSGAGLIPVATDPATPGFTPSATATASVTPTSTASATARSTTAPLATATATQAAPATADQAMIEGFPSLAQSYSLSCEYAAASAVTLYWGDQVSEDVFNSLIPTSPNPHLGFRGDINGAFGGVNDYGKYAEPLVSVLEQYGYDALVSYGTVSNLKASLSAGHPVVVWITAGRYTPRTPMTQTYGGDTFTLVAGEHAVVIYGYDSAGVYIMDVSNGGYYHTEWASFLTRWGYFDNMSLVITPK